MGTFHRCHRCHSFGAVVLVDLACIFFPDKDMLFANAKHMIDIFLPDNVSPPEDGALESIIHFSYVMA